MLLDDIDGFTRGGFAEIPAIPHSAARKYWIGGSVVLLVVAVVFGTAGVITSGDAQTVDEADLAQLDQGQSLSFYNRVLLGEPQITRPLGQFTEKVWITDRFAVQAVVRDDEVLGYSITTRSADFHPTMKVTAVRLGQTHFQETPRSGVSVLVGLINTVSGNWWYSEAVPPGGATHFITYVFTASWAGVGELGNLTPNDMARLAAPAMKNCHPAGPLCGPVDTTASGISQIRSALAISTCSVLGPDLTLEQLPVGFQFGLTRADDDRFPVSLDK